MKILEIEIEKKPRRDDNSQSPEIDEEKFLFGKDEIEKKKIEEILRETEKRTRNQRTLGLLRDTQTGKDIGVFLNEIKGNDGCIIIKSSEKIILSLPWETFLISGSIDLNIVFVRTIEGVALEKKLFETQDDSKLLTDTDSLNNGKDDITTGVVKEIADIYKEIKPFKPKIITKIDSVDILNGDYKIFHIAVHGGPCGLQINRVECNFENIKSDLFFLNSCFSAAISSKEGLPFGGGCSVEDNPYKLHNLCFNLLKNKRGIVLVGMQESINDDYASCFAPLFYKYLFETMKKQGMVTVKDTIKCFILTKLNLKIKGRYIESNFVPVIYA